MQDADTSTALRPPLLKPLPELTRERGYEPLRVEGELPPDLAGIYVNNGPAKWSEALAPHWFDGIGAIRSIRISDGTAQGAVRFIHTPSVDADLQGRRHHIAFKDKGGVRDRIAGLFGGKPMRNLANINVVPWRGDLLALMEATLPVEVSLDSLESRGETDLDGVLRGALQAHFHRVPSRRTTYFIGERVGAKVHADLYAFPDEGKPRLISSLELPGVTELHDFAVTEHQAILILTPLWAAPLRLLWNGTYADSLEWKPERGTEIVAISLDTGRVTHRLSTEPFFFWHVANAWERNSGGPVEVELVRYPDFARSVIFQDPAGLPDRPFEPSYVRGSIDFEREEARWEARWRESCEFPRIHPHYGAQVSRHVWMAAQRPEVERKGWPDRLVCLDTETGEADWKMAGHRCAIGEPAVVPRGEEERDAWILALAWDIDSAATQLAVWDGRANSAEPVARVWFPDEVPIGLHGCWIPR